MSQPHEPIAGLAAAWATTLAAWANAAGISGFSINGVLTGLLTLTTILWTIERARTERAKRRAIEGYAAQDRRMLRRLMDRFRTRPAAFDSRLDPPS